MWHYSSNRYEIAGAPGAVTVTGSDGMPVQVPQAVLAQAQLGLVQPGPDGTVTVQGSDGQPVQITQAALAASQTSLQTLTGGKKHNTAWNKTLT